MTMHIWLVAAAVARDYKSVLLQSTGTFNVQMDDQVL